MADNVSWRPAIVFYLLYVAGILYFAVLPGIEAKSLAKAAANGALLDAMAYGAYELTNLATLKNWPLPVTVVDLAWGIILTAVAACAGYLTLLWLR